MANEYDRLQTLADQRGIFFPAAEIHGSLAGFWDFGHTASNIRRKIVDLWRREVVRRLGSIEMEGCLILPKKVFEASGHLKSFADPLVVCTKCKRSFRADKLLEDVLKTEIPEALSKEKFDEMIKENNVKCPSCGGALGKTDKFNMMMGLTVGPVAEGYNAYLRPETCQSIFASFMKIYKTSRVSLPLPISQVGKSFRNEISPRQSLLRTREFTQMETEIFFNPKNIDDCREFEKVKDYKLRLKLLGEDKVKDVTVAEAYEKKLVSGKSPAYWLYVCQNFFEKCGITREKMRFRELEEDARAFYSKETWDFEVLTSTGWLELVANNYRTDYDLKSHSEVSGTDLSVTENEEKFIPHVWEISIGLDRTFYTTLELALSERDKKPLLSLPRYLAPYDAVILPLVRKDGVDKKAKEAFDLLKLDFDVKYDEKQSIGKRYLIYDALGVPLAVTIDYESLENDDCTIRDRDTAKQRRVKISELPEILRKMRRGEDVF
ncbi:MAG: glycine--tRNA ligase [Candidatus Micrarchaeota archaeon]|nr:glycine--tRNA ligase [Candidatus Micrarchaeota archaeon]